jgi:hypothetical protein
MAVTQSMGTIRNVLSITKVNVMLKEKFDSKLFPALLFAVLVIYLLFSDPNIIGPF